MATLSAATNKLVSHLHAQSVAGLADALLVMNCYYSNLIEGHNTTHREIERALANQFATAKDRRNLQVEARAHIAVQRETERRFASRSLGEPTSVAQLKRLHRAFNQDATDAMLTIRTVNRERRMVPGEFRSSSAPEVAVGRHLLPGAEHVAGFMDYFAAKYCLAPLGMGQRLLAMAASHHRFNIIQPVLDGNGRVSRRMSHAMGHNAGIRSLFG